MTDGNMFDFLIKWINLSSELNLFVDFESNVRSVDCNDEKHLTFLYGFI